METLRNDIRVELQKFGPTNFEDAFDKARNIESVLGEHTDVTLTALAIVDHKYRNLRSSHKC